MRYDTILIDTMAVLHRAFYSGAKLSTMNKFSSGEAGTSIPVGLIRKYIDLRDKYAHQDTRIIMCQDRSPQRKRSIDPEYKAGRNQKLEPAVVDDRNKQIQITLNIIDMLPVYRAYKMGEECDDILFTLSRRNCGTTLIATNDHDILQCLKDDVHLLSVKTNEITTEERFTKEMGITPKQFGLVQSLCGDPTDNVPGIKGIGEKTAIKIVQEYPDIEDDILARKVSLDRLSGRAVNPFKKDLYDTYIRTKSLVMLENVPFVTLKSPEPNIELLKQTLTEMDCTSLLMELEREDWT